MANSCVMLHRGLIYSLTVLTALPLPPQTDQFTQWQTVPNLQVPGALPRDGTISPSLQAGRKMPPHACGIADPEKNECKLEETQEKCLSVGICIPQVFAVRSLCAFTSLIPDILPHRCESAKEEEKSSSSGSVFLTVPPKRFPRQCV